MTNMEYAISVVVNGGAVAVMGGVIWKMLNDKVDKIGNGAATKEVIEKVSKQVEKVEGMISQFVTKDTVANVEIAIHQLDKDKISRGELNVQCALRHDGVAKQFEHVVDGIKRIEKGQENLFAKIDDLKDNIGNIKK